MSFKGSVSLLALSCFGAVLVPACSSNNGTPYRGMITVREGGSSVIVGTGGDAEAGILFDGTSGQPCTSKAQCTTEAGPGINICSNSLPAQTFTNVKVALFSSPICIVPPAAGGNCDPAPPSDPTGQIPHFCDGPDQPGSPGLCVPLTNPTTSGAGLCLPVCTFALDGSAAMGCTGTNACAPQPFVGMSTSGEGGAGSVFSFGTCTGACQTDADCSPLGTGYVCQTDIGSCTTTKVTRSKQLGQSCSTAGTVNDLTRGACNCLSNSMTNDGYCTSSCVIGGAPCPNGWVCDTLTPNVVGPLSDGSIVDVTQQSPGTVGVCVVPCELGPDGGPVTGPPEADAGTGTSTTDSGAATDGPTDAPSTTTSDAHASQSCPSPSTCQLQTAAGPDCLP